MLASHFMFLKALSDFQGIKSRTMMKSRMSTVRQTPRSRHLDTGVLIEFIVTPPSEPMRNNCCPVWGTNLTHSMVLCNLIDAQSTQSQLLK